MLKRIVSYAVLAVCLSVSGCASSSGTSQKVTTSDGNVVTTYDDPKYGLRLTYPGSWEEVTFMRPKNTILLLAPPNKGGLGKLPPAVAVVVPDAQPSDQPQAPPNLDAIQQRTIEKAKGEIDEFQLLDASPATVGGVEARRVVYTGRKLGQPLQVMYLLTTHGGHPYAFSYMSAPETFDDYRPAVDAMAGSVKWMKR